MIRPFLQRSCVAQVTAVVLLAVCQQAVHAQWIVAHRGASDAAPENTLAAFQLAWELGADAIEGDFRLTRDGHIVTIHDDNTERTAGIKLVVAESTLEELRRLDVGAWKSPAYRGQRIPAIQEVLATVPAGKMIFIEIKCGPEIVPKLQQALNRSGLTASQIVVISFHDSVISAVKKRIPAIKAHWLTSFKEDKVTGLWTPNLDEVLATLRRSGADGLDTNANRQVVNEPFVRAIRNAGYEFHVWTIDEPQDARQFQQLGADSITTNRPRLIRQQLPVPTR